MCYNTLCHCTLAGLRGFGRCGGGAGEQLTVAEKVGETLAVAVAEGDTLPDEVKVGVEEKVAEKVAEEVTVADGDTEGDPLHAPNAREHNIKRNHDTVGKSLPMRCVVCTAIATVPAATATPAQ